MISIKKFFNYSKRDKARLNWLCLKEGIKKIDNYDNFLKDLFEIRHPHFYKKNELEELKKFKEDLFRQNKENTGIWIYFPWLREAHLCPPEEIYLEILTARNKPLISDCEQKNFYNFNLGVVGLSVGQSTVLTVIRSGGCKNIKIADPDTIDPTNLNRLQVGINSLGRLKTDVISEKILEINPYCNIQVYRDGLSEKNIDDFFEKEFRLNAIVDACDFFPIKMALRQKAKTNKIPVLMSTDLGDAILMDIERYDLNDKVESFGGRLGKLKGEPDFMKSALAVISPEYIPLAVQDAIFEIGSTIPTHPQLGSTTLFAGVATNYALRALANKKIIHDKRFFIDLDEHFDPRHQQEDYRKIKLERTEALKKLIGME